jgi:excisionase family DNA binding protein
MARKNNDLTWNTELVDAYLQFCKSGLSIQEAARRLGVSISSIYNAINRGHLPPWRTKQQNKGHVATLNKWNEQRKFA